MRSLSRLCEVTCAQRKPNYCPCATANVEEQLASYIEGTVVYFKPVSKYAAYDRKYAPWRFESLLDRFIINA